MGAKRMRITTTILLGFLVLALGCSGGSAGRAVCGNGQVEGDEQCDDGLGGTGTCSVYCLWQEFVPEPETWRSVNPPAVSVAEDGHFVVAWDRQNGDNSGSAVFASVYDRNGVLLWGPGQLNSVTAGDQLAPQVAADESGAFTAVWESGTLGEREVYIRQFAAETFEPVGIEQPVFSDTVGEQHEPAVARLPGGGAVVSFTALFQDGDGACVMARRYGGNTLALGDAFQVNTYWENDQENSSVASNAEGRFVVAWESRCQESG